jgi:hypothetical protein
VLAYLIAWRLPDAYTVVPSEPSGCRVFVDAPSQGNCGACAAFAVASLISMRMCLYAHEDFVLSPYRLFDCCENSTCKTGTSVGHAMEVLQRVGIGDLRDSPPQYGLPCESAPTRQRFLSRGVRYHLVGMSSPRLIRAALWLYGPLVGAMHTALTRDDANGVYRFQPDYQPPSFNDDPMAYGASHAIVVVGWDHNGDWIVHNSWGHEWGDGHGRGRIAQAALYDVHDPSAHDMFCACLALLVLLALANAIEFSRTIWTQRRGVRPPLKIDAAV